MDIKKPQLVKVEAFAYFFCREFCNTLRNFWQIEGDGASRFTAFVTDMALVTCFVW